MKVRWILFVSLLILAGNFTVSLINMRSLETNRQWVAHSQDVLSLINSSKIQMIDAENEAILYLSKQRDNPSPYTQKILVLQDLLRDLESAVDDNTNQIAKIRVLREFLRKVSLDRTSDNDLWMLKRLEKGDRSDFEKFHTMMNSIRDDEQNFFQIRKKAIDHTMYRIYITIIAAVVVGFICVIATYLLYWKDVRARNSYEKTIVKHNENLKDIDHQRQLLTNLGQKALAGISPEDLMEMAGRQLSEALEVEYAKFLRLESDGSLLLIAGVGWHPDLIGKTKINSKLESQAGYALSMNLPVIVDDLRAETRFHGPNLLTQHDVVSGMSVIIPGSGDKPWGVLGVHSKKHKKFTEENIHFLQGVANIIAEVHQRDKYEKDLKLAKEAAEAASKAKDQFLAVLSHEMRTPLTPCLLAASSMATQAGIPEECRKAFSDIQKNLELEARLIDDLLDVMLIVKGKMSFHMTIIDAHHKIKLAADICHPTLRDKQIELVVKLDASQKHITADAARFQQVVWNLIKNAVKYTPNKGKIVVHTYNVDDKFVLEVNDNGIGINADVMPIVFDAFIQGERNKARKYGGLGLGLAISKAIILGHEGDIRVESEGDGKGAKFIVGLPATSPPALERPKIEDHVVKNRPTYHIFYVEDDPSTRTTTTQLLEALGHKVTTARNFKEAMDVDPDKHDILVSDIGLGDGTGVELMTRIRHKGSDIPGLAVSGYGTKEDIQQSMEVGFAEHLTKPIPFTSLEDAIRRVAGTRRRAS